MLLRELLRNYNWMVIETTDSVDNCLAHMRRGQAQLVIVDDTSELPASATIRQLLMDPLALLTPMLAFTTEQHSLEVPCLRTLGMPKLVSKPLTPDKFLPGFNKLIEIWSGGFCAEIRLAASQLVKANEETGLRILTKLNDIRDAQPLVSPSLAKYYYRSGNVKTAEKVLLVAMKNAPRNMGLILALSDFYLHCAMPDVAFRLLSGARSVYGNAIALLPDLIQACLMSGRISEAIGYMRDLQARGYMQSTMNEYISKCLYAEGREAEFRKIVGRPSFEQQLDQAWNPKSTVSAAS